MIELNDIIEAASSNIKSGILILHNNMTVHPKFKVYKRFCYDLYFKETSNPPVLIYSTEIVKNCPADMVKEIWEECDKSYLKTLIQWFTSVEYRKLCYGI